MLQYDRVCIQINHVYLKNLLGISKKKLGASVLQVTISDCMRVVSFFRQENLKRPLTFMTMHHKTKVEMAWISCGKLFVNVREGWVYSLEFQYYSSNNETILERGLILCRVLTSREWAEYPVTSNALLSVKKVCSGTGMMEACFVVVDESLFFAMVRSVTG